MKECLAVLFLLNELPVIVNNNNIYFQLRISYPSESRVKVLVNLDV